MINVKSAISSHSRRLLKQQIMPSTNCNCRTLNEWEMLNGESHWCIKQKPLQQTLE